MDAASRRPQLPALSYLDVEKAKREEDTYQNQHSSALQGQHSAPAASPTYQYPSGPPPPYSHPPSQHANSWPGVKVQPPSESCRTSGDERDNVKQIVRQSLPSISEALGVDSQTSYPPATSAGLPPSQSSHLPQVQSIRPPSSPSAERRSYGMDPPQPHNPYQYSTFRQDSAGPPSSYPPADPARLPHLPPQEVRPPLQLHTPHALPPRSQPPATFSSSQSSYEQQQSQPGTSMPPPAFPYGYAPYPPKYAQPTTSSHSSGPIYQPSTQFAAPSTPSSTWKAETSRYGQDDRTYGDAVKRHLDIYDLEGALSEIAQTSGIMLDFSRRYGDRMHQNARTGPSLSTMPSVVEVEDMIQKSRVQLDSLTKIREVIVAQQAAYDQQLADQRHHQKAFAEQPSAPTEHLLEDDDDDDMKGGFAGSETKKRRGRAAPPGRCHSCNRAETPEWRRGPDGARTLCNACGLHYAKLTRKQTTANKSANVGSSNLRPKEV